MEGDDNVNLFGQSFQFFWCSFSGLSRSHISLAESQILPVANDSRELACFYIDQSESTFIEPVSAQNRKGLVLKG